MTVSAPPIILLIGLLLFIERMAQNVEQNPEDTPPEDAAPSLSTAVSVDVADPAPEARPQALPHPQPVPKALPTQPAHLETLADRARTYVEAASSKNTRRAFAADWKHFSAWCRRSGLSPLPPEPQIVGLYITACASAR